MRFANILIVGGSGFIGRHLAAALVERGASVTVPTRRRERSKHLLPLPTLEVVEANVHDHGMLERLVRGRDLVVNLTGILHSRRGRRDERGPNDYGPDFARVHVELPQALVSACRAAGVRRLLHMSALGAAPNAPSEYLRSKGVGESVVMAADDLDATVFRPSVVFGPDDAFLNMFAKLAGLPVLALACPQARFQPVYVGDVVQAFLAALDSADAVGQRFDLCGPKVYSLKELVEYVCAATGRRRLIVGLPDSLSYLQARLLEWTPGPLMSRDNYRSMQVRSVCNCPFPFGIAPQALEVLAPSWLVHPRTRDHFSELRARAGR